MADKPEVQLYDIKDYHHGADQWFGITGINVTKNLARLRPFRKEGELIASTVNRVADDGRFPVEFTMRSKSQEVLFSLLDQAKATVTFGATSEAGTAKTVTMTNVLYDTAGAGITVAESGEFQIHGVASTCTIA